MLTAIAKPFGMLMLWLYKITGNYGLAIIIFGIIVNLILLPFMMKSKKSMMQTTRLQPRLQELQRRHEGNKQKLNEEMQKFYREEKINPMGGCLWSLLPFPILIALYQAIRMPITIMMGVPAGMLAEGGVIFEKLNQLGFDLASYGTRSQVYAEIFQSKFIAEHFAEFSSLSDKLVKMDYRFLGLDISLTPNWKIWETDWSNRLIWLPALVLFLIPIISTAVSYLSMQITQKLNKPVEGANEQAAAMSKSMLMFMPLMSLWIGFIMPASMGIYWIVNSTVGVLRDVVLTKIYTKQLDLLDADRKERERIRDEELERKRLETERLRELNATTQSRNTSKKKLQAGQKQADEERRAAIKREERRARRERLGISEAEQPESQVGNRRYARGRAYVSDRYSNPEGAEEATLAAAEESEFGDSIDTDFDERLFATEEELTALDKDSENELTKEVLKEESYLYESFDDESDEADFEAKDKK
ncbi:MAG: membrane protein insertase YidC [Ruminococcaceae bacterium]|nr:membrane protein insertase YidC [Oscillospiraceae bacterium]